MQNDSLLVHINEYLYKAPFGLKYSILALYGVHIIEKYDACLGSLSTSYTYKI